MKKIVKYRAEYEGVFFTLEVEVEYHIDSNYGADADGQRGIERTFIDDVKIISISGQIDEYLVVLEFPKTDDFPELIENRVEEYLWN